MSCRGVVFQAFHMMLESSLLVALSLLRCVSLLFVLTLSCEARLKVVVLCQMRFLCGFVFGLA